MSEHPIRAIRRAGVPLACFETVDPALSIRATIGALNGKADATALLSWDIAQGIVGLNGLGKLIAAEISPDGPMQSGNPFESLSLLRSKAPADTICFWHNAQNYVQEPTVKQALWNLRDVWKGNGSTLIMLAPAMVLPDELKNDVVIIGEALPNVDEIKAIVGSICEDAKLEPLTPEVTNKAADALLGLSAFAAEQCLAMSVSKNGLDLGNLWERKRKMIEQTPGLSVWRGGETFSDIGGCDNVKAFMRDIARGQRAPRAIAFIDEIEKSISGASGDLSGVSQDYLGALLTFMQDKQAAGIIFIGPPGAAKSAVAKATGNETNIPTIQVDLGAMKGSLVGQSEKQLRQALNVIDAVSQGQTLFIATCNSFGNLPPELKRRFTLGTFFFDLPTKEEREKIWEIYRAKYGLSFSRAAENFIDDGWTGAEIRQCCEIAWRLGRSTDQAAKFIVPVAKSASETIERLRKSASGKFISASVPGVYQVTEPDAPKAGRRMSAD
jgi:hypothetical protein